MISDMLCRLKSKDLHQNHDNAFYQKESNWTLNLVHRVGNSGSLTQSPSHVMDSIVKDVPDRTACHRAVTVPQMN